MAKCMFNTEEIRRLLTAHHREVGQWLASTALDAQARLLQEVADGQHDDDYKRICDAVSDAYDSIMKMLFGNAWNGEAVDPAFWDSEMGQTMQRVRFWLEQDQLITKTEAALMLRGTAEAKDLVYVNSLIKRGELDLWVNPDVTNPQHAGRVSRDQVEGLKGEHEDCP